MGRHFVDGCWILVQRNLHSKPDFVLVQLMVMYAWLSNYHVAPENLHISTGIYIYIYKATDRESAAGQILPKRFSRQAI